MSWLQRHVVTDLTAETALPGRDAPDFTLPATNLALGGPLTGPWPHDAQVLYVAMGCYWGVERIYWQIPGVLNTAAGFMGGYTPNPTYEESCTGMTGHAETVEVVYHPTVVSAEELLKAFWENHDPTTPNRQGNDVGTQYRSAIYWTTPEQERAAATTRETFQAELDRHHLGQISTEIRSAADAGPFYYAEPEHQQYLFKNPGGYCNHGPNGLTCQVGVAELPVPE